MKRLLLVGLAVVMVGGLEAWIPSRSAEAVSDECVVKPSLVKTIAEDSSNSIDTPSTVIGNHVWFNGGVYASNGTRIADLPDGRIVTVPYFFGHRDSVYGTAALRDSEVGVLVDQTFEDNGYYFTTRVVRSDGQVIFSEDGQQTVQSVNYQGDLALLVELAPRATLKAKIIDGNGSLLGEVDGVLDSTRFSAEAENGLYIVMDDHSVGRFSRTGEKLGNLNITGGVSALFSEGDYVYAQSSDGVQVFTKAGIPVRPVAFDDAASVDATPYRLMVNAMTVASNGFPLTGHFYVARLDGSDVVEVGGFDDDPDVTAFNEGDRFLFHQGGYIVGIDDSFTPTPGGPPGAGTHETQIERFGPDGTWLGTLPSDGSYYGLTPAGHLIVGIHESGRIRFWTFDGRDLGTTLVPIQDVSGRVTGFGSNDEYLWVFVEDYTDGGTQARSVAFVFDLGSCAGVPSPGVFLDDDGSTFETDIEWLAAEKITQGCNPPINDEFCPDDFVTRGQMAAFLHRALGDVLDPSQSVEFVDDNGSTFEADIEWLGGTGITKGCNPPANDRYCSDDFVTRGQMAAFLVRALGYADDGGGDLFVDDDGSTFEADIDKLGTAGVTKGCNPPANDQFCPSDFVTRGQMAAFLHRALGS